ncbi:hypothetical protein, partial [Paenibacillus odorifer]
CLDQPLKIIDKHAYTNKKKGAPLSHQNGWSAPFFLNLAFDRNQFFGARPNFLSEDSFFFV